MIIKFSKNIPDPYYKCSICGRIVGLEVKECCEYKADGTIDLSKVHTRRLLKMLDNTRGTITEWEWDCMSKEERSAHNKYIDALRTELSRRPHVPNKQEAKKLRQEAAKRKK